MFCTAHITDCLLGCTEIWLGAETGAFWLKKKSMFYNGIKRRKTCFMLNEVRNSKQNSYFKESVFPFQFYAQVKCAEYLRTQTIDFDWFFKGKPVRSQVYYKFTKQFGTLEGSRNVRKPSPTHRLFTFILSSNALRFLWRSDKLLPFYFVRGLGNRCSHTRERAE